MSLLLAGVAFKSGERIRGPFGNATIGDGSFTPSGDEWDAAEAVFTATGGSGYVYIFDDESLRATQAGPDGIGSGSIGYANDWLAPSTSSAAVAEGDVRPTLTTIDGATCATFDGVDDELIWPFVDWATGTLVVLATMTDPTDANQTILEIGPLRIMAQFTGKAGPCVRVGGAVLEEFGLSSMQDRLTLLVVQFSRTANTLRLWYDGAAAWVEVEVVSWDDNPHESWTRGDVSILGHNSYNYETTGGAPVTGGIHALIAINTNAVTVAQIQAFGELAALDTSVVVNIPPYPGGGAGEPGTDELPAPITTVTLANQTQFDNWKSGPPPAGQHATLSFNPSLGSLTFDGTEANPVVIRADSILGRTVTACGDITGDNIRIWGFDWGAVSPGLLTGENTWFIRCAAANGLKLRFRAPGGHAWYCHWDGGSATRAIMFSVDGDENGINGHVKGCHFEDWAPGGANATETITVGTTNGYTATSHNTLIEDSLFENCNIGGAEDETISLKGADITVRNCTFDVCRFVNGRHGQRQLIDRCWHQNSGTGGLVISDNASAMRSCKTVGASRTEIFAGNCLSIAEDPDWYTDTGTTPSGLYPRAHDCTVDHHDAVNTAPVIGKQFSTAFNPSRAAEGTVWRSNRGITPTLALQTNTTVGGTSPIAHVAPVKLTAADVGPNAATGSATALALTSNPFSSASAHHRPIGDGATYGSDAHAIRVAWAAVVPADNGQSGGSTIGAINQGNPFGVAAMYGADTDPLRTVEQRNCTDTGTGTGNWDGGGTTAAVRIPTTNGINTNASYQCYENTSFIVQSDYSTREFFQTNNRGSNRYTASILRIGDVRGLGHGSALGERVGVSASGASVRMGMLSAAALLAEEEIGHALSIAIYSGAGSQLYELLSRSIQWPACNADSTASDPANNNGPIPYGCHLAIKTSLDLATIGLTTPQGYILGRAMRDYGVYCMDEGDGIIIRCDGSLGASASAIVADYRKLLRHLYPVTDSVTGATAAIAADGGYNQTGSIGTASYPAGGGTALAANTALV